MPRQQVAGIFNVPFALEHAYRQVTEDRYHSNQKAESHQDHAIGRCQIRFAKPQGHGYGNYKYCDETTKETFPGFPRTDVRSQL